MIRTTIVAAAGLAFVAILSAMPAQAQRARVFVASYGSDSNPCTFGSPCKTFQHGVDVVAASGEVTAIDSAGFGPITISHAVTITSPNGVEAGIVPVANHNAINIDAGSTDKIILRGLTLNGSLVPGAGGIRFNSGANLIVSDCVVENFAVTGVIIAPTTTAAFSMSNTQVSDNNFGMVIAPNGGGVMNAILDRVYVENNTQDGITVSPVNQGGVTVTFNESVSATNGGAGITVTASGSPGADVLVRNSTINNNGGTALSVNGQDTSIVVTRSMIAENGLNYTGGVYSYGDNTILRNGDGGDLAGTIDHQ